MACPLCISDNAFTVKQIEVDSIIKSWSGAYEIDVHSIFRGQSNIHLLECRNCYLQYFTPNFLVAPPSIYERLQKLDWYYMSEKWEYQMALKDAKDFRTLLEVGCGSGEFLAQAQTNGLEAEGIDLNESAVQSAQKRGLSVHRLDIRQAASLYPGKYDVVCSFQMLEHVPNPNEHLSLFCSLLKPGGRLILGLPNSASFLKYQFNILDMPPHHMTRWSSRVISYLPTLFPIKVHRIRREPLAEYHVEGYVDANASSSRILGLMRRACPVELNRWLPDVIKRTGFRRLLTGQTLYASFVRI